MSYGQARRDTGRYSRRSRDAIFVSSPDGKVVATNQAALGLFGFTLEEAIGSDVGDRFVDARDRDRFRHEMGQDRVREGFRGEAAKGGWRRDRLSDDRH